jgi:putative addiction module component (TIGR02574 family)
MNPAETLEATRSWPNEDRLALALSLWAELLDAGWQPEPDDELAAELDRRLDAHEADPTNIRTSEEVWARIRGKR